MYVVYRYGIRDFVRVVVSGRDSKGHAIVCLHRADERYDVFELGVHHRHNGQKVPAGSRAGDPGGGGDCRFESTYVNMFVTVRGCRNGLRSRCLDPGLEVLTREFWGVGLELKAVRLKVVFENRDPDQANRLFVETETYAFVYVHVQMNSIMHSSTCICTYTYV